MVRPRRCRRCPSCPRRPLTALRSRSAPRSGCWKSLQGLNRLGRSVWHASPELARSASHRPPAGKCRHECRHECCRTQLTARKDRPQRARSLSAPKTSKHADVLGQFHKVKSDDAFSTAQRRKAQRCDDTRKARRGGDDPRRDELPCWRTPRASTAIH